MPNKKVGSERRHKLTRSFQLLDASDGALNFDTWWTAKAIEHNGRAFATRHQAAKEAWAAALESAQESRVPIPVTDYAGDGKRHDAIATSLIPELRLQRHQLSVVTVSEAPHDSVKGHSRHNFIELVNPEPDTSQLPQALPNECWDNVTRAW